MAFGARIGLLLIICAHPALSASTGMSRGKNVVRGKNTVAVTSSGVPFQADEHTLDDVHRLMQDPASMEKMAQNPMFVASMQQMLADDPDGLKVLMEDDGVDDLADLVKDGRVASMGELHDGFQELTSADKEHISAIKENLKVRQRLERELSNTMKRIRSDNKRIKDDLSSIAKGVAIARPEDPVAVDSSLVEQQSVNVGTAEEIVAAVLENAKEIRQLIEVLHKRDGDELSALWKDSKIHGKLSKQLKDSIKKQHDVLKQAADEELDALQIDSAGGK